MQFRKWGHPHLLLHCTNQNAALATLPPSPISLNFFKTKNVTFSCIIGGGATMQIGEFFRAIIGSWPVI